MKQGYTQRTQRKACSLCQRTFRARPDETICGHCEMKGGGPELAPGYWTWNQAEGINQIQAYWEWNEPLPQPGETVTVHSKEGAACQATIKEALGLHNTRDGRIRAQCTVKRDWQ